MERTGLAGPGGALFGMVGSGQLRRRQGMDTLVNLKWSGMAGMGPDRWGSVRSGAAWDGLAGSGLAWHGKAWI